MCDQLTEKKNGPRAEFGTRAGTSRSGSRGPTQRRPVFLRSGVISRTLVITIKTADHNEGGGWAWPTATTKEAATGREAKPNGNSTSPLYLSLGIADNPGWHEVAKATAVPTGRML